MHALIILHLQSLVIFVWAGGISFILFKTLSIFGALRVTEEIEREGGCLHLVGICLHALMLGCLGLDKTEHGEVAYDMGEMKKPALTGVSSFVANAV